MAPIHDFCIKGDIDELKNILKQQNINERNEHNKTPFGLACEYGNIEIVKLLMKSDNFRGLNEKIGFGSSSFATACFEGHVEIVKLLMNTYGFNGLNGKNYSGWTPIMYACFNNKIEIVKILINAPGFNSLYEQSDIGITPFATACMYGRIEIVKLILKIDGFKYNEPNYFGTTSIRCACQWNQIDVVKLLLKQPDIIVPRLYNLDYKYRSLIELYNKNPQRYVMRTIIGKNIDIFRHIVFTNDDYFIINKNIDDKTRFFNITTKLSSDLQMLIVHIISNSTKQFITPFMFNDNLHKYVKKYCKN